MSLAKYRADIDGLRAVAVLSVVIFHLHASWLPSGFLGVDIFFVISGFLITSIIYRDIQQDKFTFKDFYLRRIKRILPVFFVVLFATLLVGFFLMPVEENFTDLRKSALASTLFAANLYFMRGGGYFDPNLEDKPFLHIWSLSVEEQFYFVFPILLILLLRFEWTCQRKYPILFSVGLVTLAMSFIDLKAIGITWDTYYMPHLRVPEMLVGSLLAIAWSDGHLRFNTLSQQKRSILSAICLLILFVSFFTTNIFVLPFFPGVASLIPCLATAGLLFLNSEDNSIARLMSLRPVVWIGKLSYSMYLWHWVVLAWFRYVYGIGPLAPTQLFIASLLILGLSCLSYYFVEQPTRHLKLNFTQGLSFYYLLPASLVILLFIVPSEAYGKKYLEEEYGTVVVNKGLLYDTTEGEGLIGDKSKKPTILIAGDSHTAHLESFFDYVGKKEAWCAYASAATSNPFFFDYIYTLREDTKEFADERNKFLSQHYDKYDTIIFSVYWGSVGYAKDPTFIPALDKALNRLQKEGKKIILINSLYKVSDTRLKEYWLLRYGITLPAGRDYWGKDYTETKNNATKVRLYVEQHFPSVQWLDLTPYMPRDLWIDGKPVLADNSHWNAYGAECLGKMFSQEHRLIP